jgi:predicted AAA+ superfamily ATPase
VAETLEEVRFDVDAYDLAWQEFLTCGGFPRAVAEHTRSGAVSTAYLGDLVSWLRRDVDPNATQESVPLLLRALTQRATSPFNVSRTAEDTGYPNRQSLERRITSLISTFAVLPCPQRDANGAVITGSQRKVYLTDPLLAWLPSHLRAGIATPDMTVLNEMALGVSLARAIDDLDEGRWVSGDTIGYTRSGSGNEIDFAPVQVPTSAGSAATTPLEAKWVDSRWRREARALESRYGGGLLATKSVLDLGHASWAVPAPLVALLLG